MGGTGMIDMNHKYTTRDGRAVEILRTNVKNGAFPIVGIITEPDGYETQDRWTAEGRYYGPLAAGGPDSKDLVPVPTKHEGWGCIRDDTDYGFSVFLTKGAAEKYLSEEDGRVPKSHIVLVTWEDYQWQRF